MDTLEGTQTPARKGRRSQFDPGGQWIEPWRRLAIYMRDLFSCLYCGVDLREVEPDGITLDHLIPRSKRGSDHESNLVTACRRCNCGRKDKRWREFAPDGAVPRIKRHRRRRLNEALSRAIIRGEATDPRLEARR